MLRGKGIPRFPKILEQAVLPNLSEEITNKPKARLMPVSLPTKLKLWSCPFGRTTNPGQSAKVQCLQVPKRLLTVREWDEYTYPTPLLATGILVLCAPVPNLLASDSLSSYGLQPTGTPCP